MARDGKEWPGTTRDVWNDSDVYGRGRMTRYNWDDRG